MKKFFLIGLCLGFAVWTNAQVVHIQDKQTGEPVALATLYSDQPRAFSTTNSHGQANISEFIGSERIVIRILGYKTLIKSYQDLEKSGEISLEPASIQLGELVVSATRWNQSTNDIPSKITSLSPKTVALQNPQTAADLLAVSGKVFIQKSQQGGGSPMIRGFATNRLLYTVDGVRMNTAIFRSGNLQNVISLDPFAIENTEVFFGPGSVIYGSDAIGGVMSFQTLKPQLAVEDDHLISGSAVGRYATANNEFSAHYDVNVGGRKWAMLTSISSNDYGDLKMGSYGPTEYLRPFYVQRIDGTDQIVANPDPQIQNPSGYNQLNLMQKVRFKPSKQWDIQYGFHYSETSAYARYDRHIRYKNGLPRYGEWSYGPQKWIMNHLSITLKKDQLLCDQLAIRLAHQFFEESRISRDIHTTTRETRLEQVDAWSANVDLTRQTSRRNTINYGFEWVLDEVVSTGIQENIVSGSTADGPARYPQANWMSAGWYVTDHFKVSNKILATGGVRYNYFNMDARFDTRFYPFPFETATLSNGALTGSAGIVYRPSEEWVISSNLATAFRSPNVDDMGKVFDSEPGAVLVPNPDLKAEYAWNADLGIARIFGEKIKIDLTGYYTLLENAMVRRDFQLNGQDSMMYDGTLSKVQALQNAAWARVFGIQAGLEVKLGAGFSFSSDFNYQKGIEELEDGSTSPSRHAPPMFGTSRLIYLDKNLNMQLYTAYSGQKNFDQMPLEEIGKEYMYAEDENGNPYSPGWVTLNYKVMYQITDVFTLTAGVENIMDKRYRPYSSGIVAPGRNFLISIRMKY